jgi:cytochrome P450
MWDFVRTILGNGLVVSEGDFWLRQRRMMQPQFHRQRLAGLTDLMIEAIEEAFAVWDGDRAPAQPFNLAPAFNQLTMRVIVKTLFGTGLTTTEMDQVAAAMGYVLDYMLQGMLLTTLPDWMPFPGKKRFNQSLATFDEVVYGIIAQSRNQDQPDNHLLAMLMDVVDEETNEGMTDQQLHDEIATLFLAGYETTSIALSWAIDYLTAYPDTMQKLRAEVDNVLGDRRPTFADLPNLPYSRMVLQETMRIRGQLLF